MPDSGSARSVALLLACALACDVACAQPASQPSAAASAAERAQKQTDRTMYWIRVLATTPAPVRAAAAPKTATAGALALAKPATETREKVRAVPAQAPATTPTSGPGTASAPTAVAHTANAASNPAQSTVGEAVEPSAPSTRGADITAASVANTEAAPPPDVGPIPAAAPDPGLIQVKSVQPEFPTSVVERLRKGHVEVRFEVEPGGSVIDATIVESSGGRLNSAALEAVRQWRFKPTPAFHTALVDLVFNIDKWN